MSGDATIELRVDELAAGGDGVGRDEGGRVTFIPGAVPGDRVELRLTKKTKSYARAEILRVLEASDDRVEPRCQLGAEQQCGGCPWQCVSAGAQSRAKQRLAANALRHRVAGGMELRPLLEPCEPWGWRRRARLHYRVVGRTLHLGYFAPRSNRITSLEQCPQLAPPLVALLPVLRMTLGPGLRRRGELMLLLGEDGLVHVAIEGVCKWPAVEALAAHGRVAGVLYQGKTTGQKRVTLEGGVRGSALHFAQASRAGNLCLRDEVKKALGPLAGKRVLELYAGSGNFTSLLGDAEKVIAVESAGRPSGLESVEWHVGLAEKMCEKLASEGRRVDVLLLDPPRSGAREALNACLSLNPEKIVYVSCDPATLARDLEALSAAGFEAEYAQPIDLMPQTAHLELVASLRRSA